MMDCGLIVYILACNRVMDVHDRFKDLWSDYNIYIHMKLLHSSQIGHITMGVQMLHSHGLRRERLKRSSPAPVGCSREFICATGRRPSQNREVLDLHGQPPPRSPLASIIL